MIQASLLKRLEPELQVLCSDCEGVGKINSGVRKTCGKCLGTGLRYFTGIHISFYNPPKHSKSEPCWFVIATIHRDNLRSPKTNRLFLHQDGEWRTTSEQYGYKTGCMPTEEQALRAESALWDSTVEFKVGRPVGSDYKAMTTFRDSSHKVSDSESSPSIFANLSFPMS